jgi:ankyrin repeat protein
MRKDRMIGIRVRLGLALLAVLATPALAQVGFSEGYAFFKAVRERDGSTVDRILSNPSSTSVNSRDPASGDGALHILVRRRDLGWLGYFLTHGARPDVTSRDGATALALAAQVGWREGAERLLNARANPNLANSRGETPLIFAVQRFDLAMVRLLMARGADPSLSDSVAGYSALDYARQDSRGAAIAQALQARPQNQRARPQQGPPPPR